MFTREAEHKLKNTAKKMAGFLDRVRETKTAADELPPTDALILATAAHLLRKATPLQLTKAANAARRELESR